MIVQTLAATPSFREALRFWWKLGWISFGGTAAHIALMHDDLVERKKWITNESFLHALSHCMLLPGPEAQQLAIYIGWKWHGVKGGLVAGTLFVLPSMLVLLALSIVYVKFGSLPWIAALFAGLKPAVIALIILALYKVGQRALRTLVQWITAAVAFAGMLFLNAPLTLVMLGAVLLGVGVGALRPTWLFVPNRITLLKDRYPESDSLPERAKTSLLNSVVKLVGVALLLWFVPLSCLFFFGGNVAFWTTLALFFTKAAFVTIGGSYTVLPYVAQVAVTKFHWLSSLQMTDGFALAETTPGPLIIVVAFVGFMAAYNHFHHSLWMGLLGLLLTTFYTFLPCFLFVFAGAPLVEGSHGKSAVKGALALITAVVVGAMLNLTLFLGKNVVFHNGVVALPAFDGISVLWVRLHPCCSCSAFG
jgi:chromate transporter